MLFVILIIIILLSLILYTKSWSHPKSFPPGPRFPIPFLGDSYMIGNDFNTGFHLLHKKYGTSVGMWMGRHRAVLISDFEILQDIMNKSETTLRPHSTPEMRKIIRGGESLGDLPGVLVSSGQTWTEMRRSSLHVLRDLGYGKTTLEDIIEEEIEKLMQHIDDNWLDTPLDISEFFNVSFLASLWRIISGEQLKIDDPKLKKLLSHIRQMIKEFTNPLVQMSFDSYWLSEFIHRFGITSFNKVVKDTLDFVNEYIEIHKTKHIDGDNPLTFIEAFLHKIQNTEDKNHPLYAERGILNLKNTLFDLFLAGSDTTSSTLNWAMLYMILYPEVQNKVRQEINTNVGARRPKASDRNNTPFTEAVIHEIQRKGNIAPVAVFHRSSKAVNIGQFEIPEDSLIITNLGEILNDPEHFPEPQEFKPERYLTNEADGSLKFTPHQKVVPFGIGKRRCLGETLARMSLYKFLTSLVQKYEIVSGQDTPIEDKYATGFVLVPQPYKLKFRKL